MTPSFNDDQTIYRQIAHGIENQILGHVFNAEDKLPSLREQALELEVNINTITKSYNVLLDEELIEKRRGLGFFVTSTAYQAILSKRRRQFFETVVPRIKKDMSLLQIETEELVKALIHEQEK
ncbi:DNA-binding transcriptional regulator YhcF (GntR family) [Streptohalobacillus salinus]|uniref:DNA-binding transcriptional regulator YhcF (GntR family) n=1 Tax=Streptohalobacillus salinus TaxID=621096 RepID=A0A2V3WVP9_9BACI|nr:GntR family transcriptional regulator [Streptohalobacillus salinus]PXW93172.1 DNA-binding transcriptional regulator YhcF (GntR family) [Streptohalobacillus salinus]